MLQAGEMSNSSSSNSLNMSSGTRPSTMLTMPRSRQSSVTSSQENLLDRVDSRSKNSTLTRKNSGIPMFTSPPKTADGNFKYRKENIFWGKKMFYGVFTCSLWSLRLQPIRN